MWGRGASWRGDQAAEPDRRRRVRTRASIPASSRPPPMAAIDRAAGPVIGRPPPLPPSPPPPSSSPAGTDVVGDGDALPDGDGLEVPSSSPNSMVVTKDRLG